MIRLYLDWNVMAQMKNGQHSELFEIISNEYKFIKIFSTAHIGDIHAGYSGTVENEQQIKSDLEFLSQITDDLCIYNNGKNIAIEPYSPFSLFEQQKVPLRQSEPFNLDEFADNPQLAAKASEYNQLLNRPLDGVLKEALDNPVTAAGMKQFYPGLRSDMTYGDMIRISMERFKSMNEGETYKTMRDMLQKGLKLQRDRLFDDQQPFQTIESIYKVLPITASDRPFERLMENVPEWFSRIANMYIQLDMHGYQEDKVSVGKGRRQTFKNLTNDAFHAAFASSCDFYITNDKKAYKKTKQVYERQQVNTLVLKPEEFVKHYHEFLWVNEPQMHLSAFVKILREGYYVESEDETQILKTFWLPHFLFDYFTRAQILYTKETSRLLYFLSKDKPTNGKWTFTQEIEQIMKHLSSFLGQDLDNFGEFGNEDDLDNWRGRRWSLDDQTEIRLAFPNGWLQLYLDIL
ncbi:MAG: hypothetical protein ABI203_10080 [Mucilaginibacter sp.]